MWNRLTLATASLAVMAGGIALYSQSAATMASASGVQVAVPAGWHWNEPIAQKGGPLSLTSFDRWVSGGVPPAGGAEIDITQVPAPRNLQEYIQHETEGSQSEPPVESAVQKNPAVEVAFTDTYGDLKLSTHAVYILHGARLYKIYLTFHSGDTHAAEYIAAFHEIARQARFE